MGEALTKSIVRVRTSSHTRQSALSNLAQMPLSVAAICCGDFAAFHISHGWGFAVTCVSLFLLEHMIADE